jgi:3-methyl-2-oxobutanoate hydroxymethyltransferase
VAITIRDVQGFKLRGERFVMLTCYDSTSAKLLDGAGVPLIFIGDTLGETMLGYPSTVPVTIDEIVHHAKAVRRGVDNALIVGDLPFMAYQVTVEEGMRNAARLMKEAQVNCVKLEGATPTTLALVRRLTDAGVPVMGHLGLTPQSENLIGRRVQGRSQEHARAIVKQAMELETAGAFAVVLEAVPASVARDTTEALTVPTIGIGAGPHCDGQVLVLHDLLGITPGKVGKFVKEYASLGPAVQRAAQDFQREVAAGHFPDEQHSYSA